MDMGSALVQPLAGIIGIDTTTKLHTARPGGESLLPRGEVVTRAPA